MLRLIPTAAKPSGFAAQRKAGRKAQVSLRVMHAKNCSAIAAGSARAIRR